MSDELILAEPFRTLWAAQDPFVAVEALEGKVYRELEARRTLRIEVAGHYSVIWERYNDLRRGQRIVRIRDLMSEIAWKPRP